MQEDVLSHPESSICILIMLAASFPGLDALDDAVSEIDQEYLKQHHDPVQQNDVAAKIQKDPEQRHDIV